MVVTAMTATVAAHMDLEEVVVKEVRFNRFIDQSFWCPGLYRCYKCMIWFCYVVPP